MGRDTDCAYIIIFTLLPNIPNLLPLLSALTTGLNLEDCKMLFG